MLRGIGEVSRSLDARLNPGLYVAYDPGLDCPVPPAPPPAPQPGARATLADRAPGGGGGQVLALEAMRGGALLAAGDMHGKVTLWDAATWEQARCPAAARRA